ncbi:MAG: hypothetical protein Q4C63_08680, partial [Eubacteriales bacterium]|nr:hypothetical protein [Eubacteriales bacterium]
YNGEDVEDEEPDEDTAGILYSGDLFIKAFRDNIEYQRVVFDYELNNPLDDDISERFEDLVTYFLRKR